MATLFSYFGKSPKTAATPGKKSNSSPSEQARQADGPKCDTSSTTGGTPVSSKTKSKLQSKASSKDSKQPKARDRTDRVCSSFQPGEIVWAKLEGHPSWPSMICAHPTTGRHVEDLGKSKQVHVQFFGEPPSRGWVSQSNVLPIKDQKPSDDDELIKAHREAMEALKMQQSKRIEKLYACIPSDQEESDQDINDEEIENGRILSNGVKKDNNADEDESEEESDMKQGYRKRPRRGRSDIASAHQRKRVKRCIESDSDDDEDDYKPDANESSDDSVSSGVDENEDEDVNQNSESEDEVPSKKRKRSAKSQPVKKTPSRVNGLSNNNQAVTPISTPKFSSAALTTKLSNSVSRAQSALSRFSAETSNAPASLGLDDERVFTHEKLTFLKDGHRKDKIGRLHCDPDYDPRTLLVPDTYLQSKEVTPAMKQWWRIKRDNYDTLLCFKVGKFYELYHMDAVVAVKELGLIFMKGKFAHCGFPEIAFARYSDRLVQRGYKVARVEQTETPEMMNERCSQTHGSAKVIKREVCAIVSKGTKTYNFMEAETTESETVFLLAFCEKETEHGESVFGVCFIDTSIGKFHIGQFTDDRQCSRFRTMISHYPPVQDKHQTSVQSFLPQVLYEKNGISCKTESILNHELVSAIKEALSPGSEFWESSKTLKILAENNYFEDSSSTNTESKEQGWPKVLKKMLSDDNQEQCICKICYSEKSVFDSKKSVESLSWIKGLTDSLGLTAGDDYQLALSALGACVWYLKKCLIEQELLSMRQFEEYVPVDISLEHRRNIGFPVERQHLILDGVSLVNLEITANGEGSVEGTLLEQLDHCCTAFSKRQFKQWLCSPLCHPKGINSRLDAVEDLIARSSLIDQAREIMKQMPDLERLLRRIHTIGSLRRSKDHPESRAIFYNNDVYSKRKINDLLSALDGFEKAIKVIQIFRDEVDSLSSSLLKRILQKKGETNDGQFPELREFLVFFKNAFDHVKAKKEGVILPKKGLSRNVNDQTLAEKTDKMSTMGAMNAGLLLEKVLQKAKDNRSFFGVHEDYDRALDDIDSVNDEFNRYLEQQKKRLGCRNMNYWSSGKTRYQLEVPEAALARYTPDEYHLKSQKKGYRRFWTDTIEKLLAKMIDAEERRDAALKDTMRNVFYRFDEKYKTWETAMQCIAMLDCLMSLAVYSSNADGVVCRPEVVLPSTEIMPFIEIQNSRHPCISRTYTGDDFIPNDICIGAVQDGDENGRSTCLLVTGPNMGGKSTLMRQTGIIIIMAQLGCFVPAESCRFTPVDRVFTRLGAHDRILHGESTFFVELSETATILQHATKHSLVLLDELGRGTATYDGTAIATAVVRELAHAIACRTLFSTHYHSLVDEFASDATVRLGHMACMVENEDENNEGDPSTETITFLYKLASGACPKSYGFNAAKLAGIPDTVIRKAYLKARQLEDITTKVRLFRSVMASQKIDHELLSRIKEVCKKN